MGRKPNWRLSDWKLEVSRREVLGSRDSAEDLGVFACGSLMWDPAFYFEEVRLAQVEGYRRCYSLKITLARGRIEHPSLMLSLDERPGHCAGLAFRVASHVADAFSTSNSIHVAIERGAARSDFPKRLQTLHRLLQPNRMAADFRDSRRSYRICSPLAVGETVKSISFLEA
jgi:hypothetical protein